jgi:arsenate reductase (thioredoxin)
MKKNYFTFVFVLTALCFCFTAGYSQEFSKNLQTYSDEVSNEFDAIEKSRIPKLDSISNYILEAKKEYGKAKLLLVCTHNSRRSHISQMLLQTAAFYYGVDDVLTFSGGIEVTAANKRAIDAMERAGFKSSATQKNTENPIYLVSQGGEYSTSVLYSKRYDDRQNPREKFAAIMVCSDADKSCPHVPGADNRISLPYKDPRYSDNLPSEEKTYDETTKLIAREMFYIMSKVKKQENTEAEKMK